MAREMENRAGYAGGRDAATMKPRLIEDFQLLPRDDSGGPDWEPYTAKFGDGGRVTGAKDHLSVRGGEEDSTSGDELSKSARRRGSRGERGDRADKD